MVIPVRNRLLLILVVSMTLGLALFTATCRTRPSDVAAVGARPTPGPALRIEPLPDHLVCVAPPPHPDDVDEVSTIAELVDLQRTAPESLRGRRFLLRGCHISGVCAMFGLTDHYNVEACHESDRVRSRNYLRKDTEKLPAPHVDPALLAAFSNDFTVLEVGSGFNQEDPCARQYVGHFFASADESMCASGPNAWRVLVVDREIRVRNGQRSASVVP